MKKAFDVFIELIFWIAIFASPFLTCVAIAVIIYSSNESLRWLSIIIAVIGMYQEFFLQKRLEKSMVV